MQKIMFNDRYGLTQAVIEGRKTIARREPIFSGSDNFTVSCWPDTMLKKEYVRFDFDNGVSHKCRYAIGEELAVAQRYANIPELAEQVRDPFSETYFEEEDIGDEPGYRNKMFVKSELMPHQIRITGIRCERLQDISDEDCLREGIFVNEYLGNGGKCHQYGFDGFFNSHEGWFAKGWYDTPRAAFAALIDKVSGRGTWERNPWVVVYEFELVK